MTAAPRIRGAGAGTGTGGSAAGSVRGDAEPQGEVSGEGRRRGAEVEDGAGREDLLRSGGDAVLGVQREDLTQARVRRAGLGAEVDLGRRETGLVVDNERSRIW